MCHAVNPDEMTIFSHLAHQFFITRNIFPDQKKRGFHAPLAQAVQQLFRVHPVRSIVEGQRQLPAGKAFRGGNRLVRLLHFCQIFPLHPHCQPAHDSQKTQIQQHCRAQAEQFFPHGTLILNDPIYHFRCVSPELWQDIPFIFALPLPCII